MALTGLKTPDSTPPAGDREAWEARFVACLGTIDSIILTLARRGRLSPEDAADLGSIVRLRMMADDYAILRNFQGRSSLRTYLTVVINRLLLDERVARLGKWRPSQHAKREGATAVLFERLTVRDGLSFDQACATLEINHRVPIERRTLEGLYSKVRRSAPRRFVTTEQNVEHIPSTQSAPDECLAIAERTASAGGALSVLAAAVASLTAQDRRILQLRFSRGLSIADIARTMGLKQKALYARFERLLRRLRSSLEQHNIVGRDILDIVGRADVELSAAGAKTD